MTRLALFAKLELAGSPSHPGRAREVWKSAETNALVTYTAGGIPAILTKSIPKDGRSRLAKTRFWKGEGKRRWKLRPGIEEFRNVEYFESFFREGKKEGWM
jgi:hypothetical protein